MLKKQTIIIAVLCVLFVGLIVAYFAVVKPIVEKEDPVVTEAPESFRENEQDAIGDNDKKLAYTYIESKNIQSITVKNEYGRYRVYRDKKDIPQIEGYEGIAFDEESMSGLMTSLGYASVMYSFDLAEDEKLSDYGLAKYTDSEGKTKNPATFRLRGHSL